MVCPTAFVMGALPNAAAALTDCLAKKPTVGLLQEQTPLMQDVDENVLGLEDLGHEQSAAFLHMLGLFLRLCSSEQKRM